MKIVEKAALAASGPITMRHIRALSIATYLSAGSQPNARIRTDTRSFDLADTNQFRVFVFASVSWFANECEIRLNRASGRCVRGAARIIRAMLRRCGGRAASMSAAALV